MLSPFFDRDNNPEIHRFPVNKPVDITPEPPPLKPFDRDVINLCGEIGCQVSPQAFQNLLFNHPLVWQKLQLELNNEIFPHRNSPEEFLEDLTNIWFNNNGFVHIFCGEIRGKHIGGLHYFGRYLQLQNKGLAGRLPNNLHEEEVIPGLVYTVGILIKLGDKILVHPRKGYALVTDAAELLITATKAFKQQPLGRTTCIYPVIDDDSGQSYVAVLVKDERGIITFYPDATPNGKSCHSVNS